MAGAKNAVLPLLAASILCDRPFVIRRVPWVRDVATMLSILAQLGVRASWIGGDALRVDASGLTRDSVPEELGCRMRASFCLLGPLLARLGTASVPLPGGCRIGPRPVDLHIRELRRLGAVIRERDGRLHARASKLVGALLQLRGQRGPSVTGTANLLMASVAAEGESLLFGAACEPEIGQLVRFLRRCGVEITQPEPGVLRVRSPGLPLAPPEEVTVIPDRIEAATWLCAAAATGGRILVEDVRSDHLGSVLRLLKGAGALLEVSDGSIALAVDSPLKAFRCVARPYPGVPTDVQAQLCAVACCAEGRSAVRDEVFPSRWHHVEQLRKMGADITLCGNEALIRGPTTLKGAELEAADLRGSAALVIAACSAQGRSVIRNAEHLLRGYEDLPGKLRRLAGERVNLIAEPAGRKAA